MTKGEGKYLLPYHARISIASQEALTYARLLQQHIIESTGFPVVIVKNAEKGADSIHLEIKETLGPEAYSLAIETDGIRILGGDYAGLLYGVQTLRQIIRQEGGCLPTIIIEDYPEIANRGFYHDVSRGRVPKLESLKKLADQCSYYKLNQLQLYIEHTFLFEQFHEIWRDDTPLTAEDILELDQYCRKLHIDLVPSIASFGHLYEVLRSKSYRHLCELEEEESKKFSFFDRMAHHTVDVTNEESFQMITRMLQEFIPLFSSNYVNICADETFDLGKGKSQERAKEVGTVRLYMDFLKRLCGFVKSYGKRTMFWGDIILAQPELIHELPDDVICLNWDYGTEVKDTNTHKLYRLGVKQYLCPGVHGWKHLINHYENAYRNISGLCRYAHQYKVTGILNTDWGDYGHIHHPEFSLIGLIYGAAFSWNSDIPPEETINRQISELEFEDLSGTFVGLVKEFAKQESFSWESFVEYSEELQSHVIGIGEEAICRRLNFSNALECNQNIDHICKSLYQIMPQLSDSARTRIYPYLVMAKGQQLLNITGATISRYRYGEQNSAAMEPHMLSASLEKWLYDYKKLWRSVSAESELFRIENLFFWYADFLRQL
jgi:hypothetical protein